MAMGNRKVRLGITELVREKVKKGNRNLKVRLGITELVREKAENGNGEP